MHIKNRKSDGNDDIKFFSAEDILNKRDNCIKGKKRFSLSLKKRHVVYSESVYLKRVRELWNEFRSRIISGAVTIGVVIAVCVVVDALGYSIGYEVIIDGENIGVVSDRDDVFSAVSEAKADVKKYLGRDFDKNAVFARRLISDDDVMSKDDIKNELLSNVESMVECYAIKVNGESILGVYGENEAKQVLSSYKEQCVGKPITDDMSVEFCEDVEISKTYLHIGMVKTPETAVDMLLSETTQKPGNYVAKSNDTFSGIAKMYNMEPERLLAMNKGIDGNVEEGMKIKVEKSVPLLSVKCVQTVSLVEPIEYEVEKIEDDTVYEGKIVVEQEGVAGEEKILARVTTINGVETSKDVLESEVLVQPVKQIEKIGTMEKPPTTGSGSFVTPTFGTLSSRYGMRWDRSHNGIDIAGSHGSDILAADGGVVVYADWMSGYGNYVVIDHENGYQTAYGHCSSLCVAVNDRVCKGDVIAKMGSTGRSTGTHLHFEVKKDGQFVNPLDYVNY